MIDISVAGYSEKIVERRDVFGQLIEESNLPNVAYRLGGLKIVRC